MKNLRFILIPAAAVLVVIGIVIAITGTGGVFQSDSVNEGINYLKKLESVNVADVESVLAAQRQERLAAEREQRMEEIVSGEVDVWTLFNDYALMGDSRAVGFYYFGYMPEDRVIAGGGWTIRDIEVYLDSLRVLNPSSIFLCFGLNDTSIGYWETAEEYAAEYLEVLQMLGREFPNATVYVNSILPARDPAFDTSQLWYNIPEYSAAVGKMCEENGYIFVNNDDIAEKYADLWDPDGIHVMKEFYPYWAANMIMAVYEGSEGGSDASFGSSDASLSDGSSSDSGEDSGSDSSAGDETEDDASSYEEEDYDSSAEEDSGDY